LLRTKQKKELRMGELSKMEELGKVKAIKKVMGLDKVKEIDKLKELGKMKKVGVLKNQTQYWMKEVCRVWLTIVLVVRLKSKMNTRGV